MTAARKLPTGIRARYDGATFEWNVMVSGVRLFGTAESLEQAILDRSAAKAGTEAVQPEKVEKPVTGLDARQGHRRSPRDQRTGRWLEWWAL